jgi:hypothetical protein
MIRRLLWAVLGAAVGIGSYRRISRRLAAFTGAGRGGVRRGGRGLVSYPAALPDARDPGGARGTGGAAGFIGDVRAGMAEYLARYPAHPAPGLDAERPGAGPHPRIDYVKDGH